eukprot:1993223-Amphidinium_carterae.1
MLITFSGPLFGARQSATSRDIQGLVIPSQGLALKVAQRPRRVHIKCKSKKQYSHLHFKYSRNFNAERFRKVLRPLARHTPIRVSLGVQPNLFRKLYSQWNRIHTVHTKDTRVGRGRGKGAFKQK